MAYYLKYNFLKAKIVFSIIFLLSFAFFFLLPHPFRSEVQVELNSDVINVFKIYWADSKTSYNEANSKAVGIKKGKGVYSFDIDNLLYSLEYLRIDPLISQGNVCIKRIEITQLGFEPIVFETKEQFEKFTTIHHIGQMTFKKEGLLISSVGNDPYLHTKIKPEFKIVLFMKYLLNVMLSAFVITAILYLFYRVVCFVKQNAEHILNIHGEDEQGKRKLFAITFIIIILVRFIFVLTYPLNISGDGGIYFGMIYRWQSSLALAGGYPFVFGMLKSLFDNLTMLERDSMASKYFLLVSQHITDLGVLMLMYLTLKKIFSAPIACASVLLYGLNPFILGNISTTRPEWFQSCLFMTSLVMGYLGYSTQESKKKLILYVGASLIFSLGFFVKFNLLPLASFFLLFIFLDKSTIKLKLTILATILLCCSTFYTTYVVLFQKASTGTSALTHDKSWILIEKASLSSSNPMLNINNGINTKRYKVLTWFLEKYGNERIDPPILYNHINSIPIHVRNFYRDKYGFILNANEDKLDLLIKANPEIKGFLGSPLLISHYIGLKESDDLGTKVFFETVKAEPLEYIRMVISGFYKSFFIKKENNFPLSRQLGWGDVQRPKAFDLDKHITKILPLGFSEVRVGRSRGIGYLKPVLWIPGVNLFSLLCSLFYHWIQFLWMSCLVVIVGCFFERFKKGLWLQRNFIPLVLAAIIIFFTFWSNMIHQFRQAKEFILIIPYLCIFGGIFIVDIIRLSRKLIFKFGLLR